MKYNNFWNLMGVSLICITMIGVSNANAKTTKLFEFDVNNAAPGANGCSAKVTAGANGCTDITERAPDSNGICQDTSNVRTVCPGEPGAPGAACQSKIVSERCGGSGEPSCPDTTKKGVLTKTYKCDGTTLESTSASYDGENGQNGQDFDPCNGSTSGDLLKSTTTSYSRGSKVSGRDYYAAAGKITVATTMCDNSAGTSYETPDTCEEVHRGSSNCPSGSVYKQCKPANGGAAYYVCESGTSILDIASAAEATADTVSGKITSAESAISTLQSDMSNKVNSSELNNYVTTSGSGNNSIGKILESNNVITTSNLSQNNIVTTSSLGNTVNTAITNAVNDAQGPFKAFITEGNIGDALTSNHVVTTTNGKLDSSLLTGNGLITTENIANNMPANVVTTTDIGNCTYTEENDSATVTCTGLLAGLQNTLQGITNKATGKNSGGGLGTDN